MQIASYLATHADLIAACALLCRSSEAVAHAVAGCTPVEAERVTDRLAAARPGPAPDWFSMDADQGRFVCTLEDGAVLAWARFGAQPEDLVVWTDWYSANVLWSPPYES